MMVDPPARAARPPGSTLSTATLMGLVVATLAATVYANALQNGFALDDDGVIVNSPVIRGAGTLTELLLSPYWPGTQELYRPLATLSFAADWALFDGNAAGFHAVNVLLHAVVCTLVVMLLLRLGAPALVAGIGGAIFAVHPVHVEAVANVVGRTELLATLFFLLACLLHLREGLRPVARYVGIGACYFLALGAKEIAVTLPAVLLLLDAFRSQERGGSVTQLLRRHLRLWLVLLPILAGYLGLRALALGELRGSDAAPYLVDLSTSDRLATAVRLWPELLRLLLWPQDLSWEWGPGVITPVSWSNPLVLLGLLIGVGALALAILSWRGERWVSLAVLWVAITFFPVSQIPFPIGVMIAERTLYLPSVGAVFLVPALAALAARTRLPSRLTPAAAVAVVLTLGAWRTWERTPIWESSKTALAALVQEHPSSYRAFWRGGRLMGDAGRVEEAIYLYRRAVEMNHGNHTGLNLAFARMLLAHDRAPEAIELLERTVARQPHEAGVRVVLSAALIDLGRYVDALEVIDTARREAHSGLAANETALAHRAALAYDGLGRREEALREALASLSRPDGRAMVPYWVHLARLRQLRGELALADAALDSARAHAPPALRPSIHLHPMPELTSRLLRGWGTPGRASDIGMAPDNPFGAGH